MRDRLVVTRKKVDQVNDLPCTQLHCLRPARSIFTSKYSCLQWFEGGNVVRINYLVLKPKTCRKYIENLYPRRC